SDSADSTDDTVLTDSNTGKNSHIFTYPHILLDGDRLIELCTFQTKLRFERMRGSRDSYIGTDNDMIFNFNTSIINNSQTKIDINIVSNISILPPISMKRGLYVRIFSHSS